MPVTRENWIDDHQIQASMPQYSSQPAANIGLNLRLQNLKLHFLARLIDDHQINYPPATLLPHLIHIKARLIVRADGWLS